MLSANEIKFLTALKQKKYRQQEGFSIIEHAKVILESELARFWEKIYVTGEFMTQHPEFNGFKNLQVITDKEMAKISQQTTPPGILATFKIVGAPTFKAQTEIVLLLDDLQDPGNIGTILRTADWFGIKDVFLSANCAEVSNPKTVAGSMGAFWRLNLYPESNLLELIPKLKQEKYQVLVTDLKGEDLNLFEKKGRVAIVIGSEARGVDARILKLADQKIKIGQIGGGESLNAAVAAGIVLYKLCNKK